MLRSSLLAISIIMSNSARAEMGAVERCKAEFGFHRFDCSCTVSFLEKMLGPGDIDLVLALWARSLPQASFEGFKRLEELNGSEKVNRGLLFLYRNRPEIFFRCPKDIVDVDEEF